MEIYEEAQILTLTLNAGRVLVSTGEQTREATGGVGAGQSSSEQHSLFSSCLLSPTSQLSLLKS